MEAPGVAGATLAVRKPRSTASSSCSPFNLPANGILVLSNGETITLSANAVFEPACREAGPEAVLTRPTIIGDGSSGISIDQTTSTLTGTTDPQLSDFRDPFYASTFPQCYALAAATMIAYTLVIMLFIAPRSFLDGGIVVLGRRGFTNGPSNGMSIGGRPWLQKVAALTVAISLTIATADTFRVAEEQYADGIQNAKALQNDVLDGTQLKIIRLISDTFLWLAQAQTLIRLFPRQREKIIIKWTAFSLITLDVIFGALNSFLYDAAGSSRPRNFTDAIPALSYLFQLSLGLLYAAWVIYYSLMKKRYAYYHPLMKNIALVAALSIISLHVPVVFFILDISKPDFTGWGDYVRWVGAAAASVIVWEWVERIEALEREEKKDGILGREVFDGDEMVDSSAPDFTWPRRRRPKKKDDDNDDGGENGVPSTEHSPATGTKKRTWPAMSLLGSRYIPNPAANPPAGQQKTKNTSGAAGRLATRLVQPPLWISRPPPAVTPISRTETASADSTVYAVRYQPLTETASRTTHDALDHQLERQISRTSDAERRSSRPVVTDHAAVESTPAEESAAKPSGWRTLMNFRTTANEPPAEVLPHTRKPEAPRRQYESRGWWDLRDRVEDFAATQAERLREKMRPTPDTDSLEVVVIPPPPRRGAALAQLLEEEERQARSAPQGDGSPMTGSAPERTAAFPSRPDLRIDSNVSGSSQPMLAPPQRNDTLQLRPARADDSVSPISTRIREQRGDNGIVSPISPASPSAPRRAVDDVIFDESSPSRS